MGESLVCGFGLSVRVEVIWYEYSAGRWLDVENEMMQTMAARGYGFRG
jgi:hypothetical protein